MARQMDQQFRVHTTLEKGLNLGLHIHIKHLKINITQTSGDLTPMHTQELS